MANAEALPTSEALAAQEKRDGPVLTLVNKKLRALKKKQRSILQIEESKAKGKILNKEQEAVLAAKLQVDVLIEEYEKVKQPLIDAVKEEIAAWKEKQEAAPVAQNGPAQPEPKLEAPPAPATSEAGTGTSDNKGTQFDNNDVAKLLKLLYFAQLFDVRSSTDAASLMWTKVHERISCTSYDHVREDAASPLSELDLDALATLGKLLTSRPSNNSLISHKDALERCVEHAQKWLLGSEEAIAESVPATYANLRERLGRILSSDYFAAVPELRTVSEQTVAQAAAFVNNTVLEVTVGDDSHVEAGQTGQAYYNEQEQPNLPTQEQYCNQDGASEDGPDAGDVEAGANAEGLEPQDDVNGQAAQGAAGDAAARPGGPSVPGSGRGGYGGRGRGGYRGGRGGYANGEKRGGRYGGGRGGRGYQENTYGGAQQQQQYGGRGGSGGRYRGPRPGGRASDSQPRAPAVTTVQQ